mgnify:CR=1 FL=1
MKNYIVCESNKQGEDLVYTQVACLFENTREASAWVRQNGKDNVQYVVLKVAKAIAVETIQHRKLVVTGK